MAGAEGGGGVGKTDGSWHVYVYGSWHVRQVGREGAFHVTLAWDAGRGRHWGRA